MAFEEKKSIRKKVQKKTNSVTIIYRHTADIYFVIKFLITKEISKYFCETEKDDDGNVDEWDENDGIKSKKLWMSNAIKYHWNRHNTRYTQSREKTRTHALPLNKRLRICLRFIYFHGISIYFCCFFMYLK